MSVYAVRKTALLCDMFFKFGIKHSEIYQTLHAYAWHTAYKISSLLMYHNTRGFLIQSYFWSKVKRLLVSESVAVSVHKWGRYSENTFPGEIKVLQNKSSP